MNKTSIFKRMLISVLAIAMVLTAIPMTTVTAQAAPTAIKKVVIKQGKKNVTKKTIKLAAGKSTKIKVTVTPSSAKKSIKYVSGNKKVATVSKSGKIKAKAAGTTKIKVTVTGKNKKKKTAWVKVKVTGVPTEDTPSPQPSNSPAPSQAPAPQPSVAPTPQPAPAITVPEESKSISLDAGKGSVIVLKNTEGKEIVYASSNPEVATVDPATGVIVGINPGTATITASTKDGKESVTVTVTVIAIKVTSVTLPEKTEVTVKGTTNLTAEIAPENATDKVLTWTSSDEKIATVNATGEVYGVAPGTATITATAASGVYGTCVVTVKSTETLADGISMEVTNPYVDANGTIYDKTALVGDDLNIRVRVVQNQIPVGNDSVTLTLDDNAPNGYGNMHGYYYAKSESNSASSTNTTDANGYAKFSISLKDAYKALKATEGKAQSIKVTAHESGSNKSTYIYVKFASVMLNGITVDDKTNLEPSDNAGSKETGVYWTKSQDGCKNVEYVVSQQVSSDAADHKVYLDATPSLLMPATPENIELAPWEYPVENGASGPCPVYNSETNQSTTVIVEQVPSGLNYITLFFDKVELSKYTAMNVDVYDKETGTLLKDRRVTKTADDNGTPTVQIEAQDDRESYIVVSLVSQGQVDTDSQGYILTRLVGNYDSKLVKETHLEEIENAVTWENVTEKELPIYESITWNYSEAKNYLPDNSKYLNSNYKYSYDVPSFPRVGNAIIKVKDANNKILAYFAYPTINNGKNKNILAPAPEKPGEGEIKTVYAINIAEDEAKQAVGEIEQIGNQLVVDSKTQGRTFVTAKINVAGLDETELNDQNGGLLYSSIEWAPVPEKEVVDTYKDYFAVEGQFVTIKAQLYDTNGNKKTDEGKKIEFSYVDNTNETYVISNKEGSPVGTRVKVASISNSGSTDANGQVVLKLKDETSDGYFSFVNQLSAKANGYNVKLSFILADGSEEEVVSKSNINWVDLGLTYVDSAVDADNPERVSFFRNATATENEDQINMWTTYTVSNTKGWQIGFLPIARSYKFQYSRPNDVDRFPSQILVDGEWIDYIPKHEFISVSGVNIPYNMGVRSETQITQKDNVATLYSTKTNNADKLTGGLSIFDQKGNQQKVVFKYYDDDGIVQETENIGSGEANIESTLLPLNIAWVENGQHTYVYAPKTINQNTARRIYVQVLDEYDNALKGKKVEYQITGVNGTNGKIAAIESAQPGLYYFELGKVDELTDVAECTINIFVENDSIGDPIKIAYQKDPGEAFDFFADDTSHEYYAVEVVDDVTLNVYFNHNVDVSTINAGEFTLTDDKGKALEITDVKTIEGKASVVQLNLKDSIAERTVDHTLTVKDYVDPKTGITYYLGDSYGQIMENSTYTFKPSER